MNDEPFSVSDISVIIVNYNGEHVLPDAMASVLGLEPSPRELIVVDNGSTDRSPLIITGLAERDSRVRPILAGENLGVAGGRNLAAAYAEGRVLAFLDSDGLAEPSWLTESVQALNQDPRAGAVAPLVLLADGETVNGAGSFLDPDGHGYDRYFGDPESAHATEWPLLAGTVCDYPMGCGMVVRVPGLERVWPLDEALPKWHDDTELGLRIRRLGYRTIFWPSARVRHRWGHANPPDPYAKHWLAEEARLRLLVKYFPWPRVITNLLHLGIHGVSGLRGRPQMWQETQAVLRRIWRDWGDLTMIRREWAREVRSDPAIATLS